MAIDSKALLDEMATAAATTGHFGAVIKHEPKAAPQSGGEVTFAVWFNTMRAVQSSGLGVLSVRVEFLGRLYVSMLTEPQDAIDVTIMNAMDAVFAYLAGNFTLDGKARYVDSLGSDGPQLTATAGYLTQDTKLFRIVDLMIPIIVNDTHPLSA